MNERTICALAIAAAVTALAACGGSVDSNPGDGGGGGATSGGGTSTASTGNTTGTTSGPTGTGGEGAGTSSVSSTGSNTTSVSSGSQGCTSHDECGDNLCVFATGECARACENEICESCDPGTICDGCATSSCADCDDCLGACVAPEPGFCDGDTPCGAGDVCLFDWQLCFPPCGKEGECADPSLECVPCATGSCCGCRDCVDVCLPLEGFPGG